MRANGAYIGYGEAKQRAHLQPTMLNESYTQSQCTIRAKLARGREREHLVFISKEKSLVHSSYNGCRVGDGDGSHSQSLELLYTWNALVGVRNDQRNLAFWPFCLKRVTLSTLGRPKLVKLH